MITTGSRKIDQEYFGGFSPVYKDIKGIKRIVETPYSKRILRENGEIEMSVNGNVLNISAIEYQNGNKVVKKRISKLISNNYSPFQAMENAKNDIVKRISDLETKAHQRKTEKAAQEVSRNIRTIPQEKPLANFLREFNEVYDEKGFVRDYRIAS